MNDLGEERCRMMVEEPVTPSTKMESIRKRTESVKSSMDWEDYLNLIEIATETNVNNAVDLAWRLGYSAGEATLFGRIEEHFKDSSAEK